MELKGLIKDQEEQMEEKERQVVGGVKKENDILKLSGRKKVEVISRIRRRRKKWG
jgi:hypothetical protein